MRTVHSIRHHVLSVAGAARFTLIIGLVALAFGNMGCRKIRQKMEEKAAEEAIKAGTGGQVSIDDENKGGVTFKDNKGNAVTIGENKVPADWPSSVPLYPKGKVVGAVSSKDNGKAGHMVTMETTDSADTVFAFFKSKLSGYDQQSEMNSPQMRMLVVEDKKSKLAITVVISASGSSTTVQVTAASSG